jgi:hypothetical protein
MGAVAEFVGDAFESVGDVVESAGNVFESIGNVVESVGDVVENVVNVVNDVVDVVGNVVQTVIDDPLPVLLSVAGAEFGIPPFVTMGALSAARGNDLEHVALSMGTAAITSGAGFDFTSSLSSTISSSFIDASVNETFSQVASEAISKGLVNGTISEIRGGDFEDGFAGGFVGGMVSNGVGEVGDFVKPDIIALATESGLDLSTASALYNAGARAISAGVTSEITGRGDFVTSFTNSAISSGVDSGSRSLNSTIDEQFASAAHSWNEEDKEGETIDTTSTGAGIPNDVVGQVTVSSIGFDTTADDNTITTNPTNTADTIDTVSVLNDVSNDGSSGETAVSDISVLPPTLAQAPTAESASDFKDLTNTSTLGSDDTVLANSTVPASVSDIADTLTENVDTTPETQGALTTVAEANKPVDVLDVVTPEETAGTRSIVTEAPIAENLLINGLNPEQPIGGLNAVANTADKKMADSLGSKPTDITKPIVSTVGNLFKSAIKQGTNPQARNVARPTAKRPAGALQTMARADRQKRQPPARMNVANLIPIQKAVSYKPPTTLASTANLSPVSNITGLTSLVKKTG